jgi:hypothetical protein
MANENERKTYVVKPGFTHGINDQYKAGDKVQLTEYEAGPLADKLELYDPAKKDEPATSRSFRNAVRNASDEELLAFPGVSQGNLSNIRSWALSNDQPATAPSGQVAAQPANSDTGATRTTGPITADSTATADAQKKGTEQSGDTGIPQTAAGSARDTSAHSTAKK